MTAVYSNDVIITQIDDGVVAGEGVCTSSSSMPAIMLAMLNHLDTRAGQQVLEIGTGTGYNAALLAHRLGAGNVVSIEIDPEIAQQARTNLAKVGRDVRVITGDGALAIHSVLAMIGSSPPARCRPCPGPGWHRPGPVG